MAHPRGLTAEYDRRCRGIPLFEARAGDPRWSGPQDLGRRLRRAKSNYCCDDGISAWFPASRSLDDGPFCLTMMARIFGKCPGQPLSGRTPSPYHELIISTLRDVMCSPVVAHLQPLHCSLPSSLDRALSLPFPRHSRSPVSSRAGLAMADLLPTWPRMWPRCVYSPPPAAPIPLSSLFLLQQESLNHNQFVVFRFPPFHLFFPFP